MKIKITEIEATAEDLRQSNSLADSFSRLLRNSFTSYPVYEDEDEEDEDEQADV